jgi:hypothetical protein
MTTILFSIIKEIVLSMVGKIAFKHVGERLATRLVVYGLNKLKGMSSNTVTTGLVDDILMSLEGKGLKAL